MTDRELRPVLSSVRNWLLEIGNTLPIQFSEHVAIIVGELTRRLKEQENDHQRPDQQ